MAVECMAQFSQPCAGTRGGDGLGSSTVWGRRVLTASHCVCAIASECGMCLDTHHLSGVSASSCWSHFSCPVSLSSHRARLFWVGFLIVAPPHYQMSGTCSWLTGSSNYTSVPARIWKARGEGLVGLYKRQTIPLQVPVWEDQRARDNCLPLWEPKEGFNILKHITVLT